MKLKIISTLLTSAINTGVVTCVITLVHNGLPFQALSWLQTWLLAFCIISPLGMVVPERVRALVSRWLKEPAAIESSVTAKEVDQKEGVGQ